MYCGTKSDKISFRNSKKTHLQLISNTFEEIYKDLKVKSATKYAQKSDQAHLQQQKKCTRLQNYNNVMMIYNDQIITSCMILLLQLC